MAWTEFKVHAPHQSQQILVHPGCTSVILKSKISWWPVIDEISQFA